ncbi:MAG: hypothetical protein HYZ42_05320, partial [Bacteroidetes bacterium]|nr:hypothetical protein [Bacteroidota bacterium]
MFCKNFQYLLLLFVLSLGESQAQCNKEDFAYDNATGCLPLSVKFKALNYTKGSQFAWDFGQGFSNYKKSDSTKINIYIAKGLKSVSLKIKDSLGNVCTIDKYDIIDVGQATQIDIKISKSILCSYADSSILTDSTSNVLKREWIIDGVKMINAPASIAVKFNKPGYKSIALKVTNTSGCIYTKILDSAIQVFNMVNANFVAKATTFCPIYNDTFWNTTQSNEKVASMYWLFQGGNPSTSTDTIPVVSYSDTGRFDVTMYVQYTNGCSYNQTKAKYITPFNIIKPRLAINTHLLCNSDTLTITNNTPNGNVAGNYTVNTYLGSIVGGSIATNNLKVIYSNAGKHSLKISYNNINCYADTIYDSLVTVSKLIQTAGHENVVIVMHEDSTYARYVHLTTNGALVTRGQTVMPGDTI